MPTPRIPTPELILWVPAELTDDQKTSLINVLAYLKVEEDYPGTKYAKDARRLFSSIAKPRMISCANSMSKAKRVRPGRRSPLIGPEALMAHSNVSATDTLDECYRAAEDRHKTSQLRY